LNLIHGKNNLEHEFTKEISEEINEKKTEDLDNLLVFFLEKFLHFSLVNILGLFTFSFLFSGKSIVFTQDVLTEKELLLLALQEMSVGIRHDDEEERRKVKISSPQFNGVAYYRVGRVLGLAVESISYKRGRRHMETPTTRRKFESN